jgi:cell division protease FtsH
MSDPWLPIGFPLSDRQKAQKIVAAGREWQIIQTTAGSRALLCGATILEKWKNQGLIGPDTFSAVRVGSDVVFSLISENEHELTQLTELRSPSTKDEAMALAYAFKATRALDESSPLQDAIYVERISRLLPTYEISSEEPDDIVFGFCLTGGAHISVNSFRRLSKALSWLPPAHLGDVLKTAGFIVNGEETTPGAETLAHSSDSDYSARTGLQKKSAFELPGRPELAEFFNEHVVDIVLNSERYRALGITSPGAVILHGPPGCGKTYAVERLTEYLGWPSFEIDASTIGSPYIHETSKKVAQIFEAAIDASPSVLVIDEMDAFLTDREAGSGHHRVEEVAEFLRRIPEATKQRVLILAMTNRIELIDPAILRRGRFDHILKIDFANEIEVRALLDSLFSKLPTDKDVDAEPLAKQLAGRPLSDVAFVVREGARLAAKAGRATLDQASLVLALNATGSRNTDQPARRIGFV